MSDYKKFIFEDLPKSAVVNSGVYDNIDEKDDFIINAVSDHLNSIIEPALIQVVDETVERDNIDRIEKENLIRLQSARKEEYERGIKETEEKYKPLLENANTDTKLAVLLREKIEAVNPAQDLDLQISKVSAEAISGIAKKLHLILPANFEEIISKGLIDKLKKFYKEGEIILKINPEKYDFCKEILQSNSIPDNIKESFKIVQDDKMGSDDCSLEWQDTRLEYNQEQLSSEIDKIVEQLKTAG